MRTLLKQSAALLAGTALLFDPALAAAFSPGSVPPPRGLFCTRRFSEESLAAHSVAQQFSAPLLSRRYRVELIHALLSVLGGRLTGPIDRFGLVAFNVILGAAGAALVIHHLNPNAFLAHLHGVAFYAWAAPLLGLGLGMIPDAPRRPRLESDVSPDGWHRYAVRFSNEFVTNFIDDEQYTEDLRNAIVGLMPRIRDRLLNLQELYADYGLKGEAWGDGLYRISSADRRLYFTISPAEQTVTILAFRLKSEIRMGGDNRTDPTFIKLLHEQKTAIERDPEVVRPIAARMFGTTAFPRMIQNPLLHALLVPPDRADARDGQSKLLNQWRVIFFQPLRKKISLDEAAGTLFQNERHSMNRDLQQLHNRLIHRYELARWDTQRLCMNLSEGVTLFPGDARRLATIINAWSMDWLQMLGWLKGLISHEFGAGQMPNVMALGYLYYTLDSRDLREHIGHEYDEWVRRQWYLTEGQTQQREMLLRVMALSYQRLRAQGITLNHKPFESPLVHALLQQAALAGLDEGAESDSIADPLALPSQQMPPIEVPAPQALPPVHLETAGIAREVSLPLEPEGWTDRFRDALAEAEFPRDRVTDALLSKLHELVIADLSRSAQVVQLKEYLDLEGFMKKQGVVSHILSSLESAFVPETRPVAPKSRPPQRLLLALGREISHSYHPLDLIKHHDREFAARLSGTSAAAIQFAALDVMKLLEFDSHSHVLEIGGGGRANFILAAYAGAHSVYVQKQEPSLQAYEEEQRLELRTWQILVSEPEKFRLTPAGLESASKELDWATLRFAAHVPKFDAEMPGRLAEFEKIRQSMEVGSIEGIRGDAAELATRLAVYERVESNRPFTHLLATDVVGVSRMKGGDFTLDMAAIENIFELIARVADPAGALILFSVANRENAVDDPEALPIIELLREILTAQGLDILSETRIATPASFGRKRGYLFKVAA